MIDSRTICFHADIIFSLPGGVRGGALPLLLNGSLSLEFQSEKDTAEGKRAIEEVITLQLFDRKKKNTITGHMQ